ncbi:MAG: hypothetical protein PSN04_03215 [Methyloprofundus sp.]|nr:hypothetical protein [Methyloprofundus sp.]
MGFGTGAKIAILILWPFVFLAFLYFKDKEKFKRKWEAFWKVR